MSTPVPYVTFKNRVIVNTKVAITSATIIDDFFDAQNAENEFTWPFDT
jgi:hypothetical protein